MPFVLRATGKYMKSRDKETTQLIADSYIPGIINGEGMDFEGLTPQGIWMS